MRTELQVNLLINKYNIAIYNFISFVIYEYIHYAANAKIHHANVVLLFINCSSSFVYYTDAYHVLLLLSYTKSCDLHLNGTDCRAE